MTMSTTAAGSAWMNVGACREAEPELFFPVSSAGPALAQVAAAKAVCARCQVREDCLQYALETAQDHGVWGGLSEDERRSVRRAARPPSPLAR